MFKKSVQNVDELMFLPKQVDFRKKIGIEDVKLFNKYLPLNCFFQDVVAVKEAYEDVWTGLDVSEQEQIINESIIRPDAILRYEGHVAIRDSARHPSANTAEVRLSSFGVDKVFPRFKVQSGQKENTFEDTSGSQGEDLGSDCVSST